MDEFLSAAVAQWGMAGLFVIAAGYIIWSNHKEAKETKKKYEDLYNERMEHMEERYAEKGRASASIQKMNTDTSAAINKLGDKIDSIATTQVEMGEKINELDTTVNGLVNKARHADTERYTKIIRVAPTLNTICVNNMEEMRVDHIFVALLHNGTSGITGIPFIRQSVIVEKYDPIKNINDINYTVAFKDDELTKHDKLPAAILQNDIVDINVNDNGHSKMEDLDIISAREMAKIGTKRILFKAIKDERGVPMGYICAYSYITRDVDLELFRETAETIERVYRDVCE